MDRSHLSSCHEFRSSITSVNYVNSQTNLIQIPYVSKFTHYRYYNALTYCFRFYFRSSQKRLGILFIVSCLLERFMPIGVYKLNRQHAIVSYFHIFFFLSVLEGQGICYRQHLYFTFLFLNFIFLEGKACFKYPLYMYIIPFYFFISVLRRARQVQVVNIYHYTNELNHSTRYKKSLVILYIELYSIETSNKQISFV